jgi:hypothetical protein
LSTPQEEKRRSRSGRYSKLKRGGDFQAMRSAEMKRQQAISSRHIASLIRIESLVLIESRESGALERAPNVKPQTEAEHVLKRGVGRRGEGKNGQERTA